MSPRLHRRRASAAPPPPPAPRGTLRVVPSLRLGLVGLAAAAAFDIDAHDAVGQTCASALDREATRQVKRLFRGLDASEVAGWGHQVDDTFPGVSRMHFQVHDDQKGQLWCGPSEGRVPQCQDGVCLLASVKHFYGKVLADEGRAIEYPAMDYDKVEPGVWFSDADAVKMLLNLLGDLHQPLHVGFASDDSGKALRVRFRGKTMSLYDFWDRGISETIREDESGFWLGGWTHISAVSDEFSSDRARWAADGAFRSFERWLDETVQLACSVAYIHPTTGKMLGGPSADPGHIVDIDDAAYRAWRGAWLKQILLAGARTAIVLNDILDASGAARLERRSGVSTRADEAKEERAVAAQATEKHRRMTSGFAAFLTNVGIACVVVPLFFLCVRRGLDPKVHAEFLRALLEGAGTGSAPCVGFDAGGRRGKRRE